VLRRQGTVHTFSGNILPDTTETYDIGSSTLRFNDIYLAGSTVDIGGTKLSKDSNGDLDIKDSSDVRKTIKAAAIELFDTDGKAIKIERDATTGKMKTRKYGSDGSEEASQDVIDISEDLSPKLGGNLDTNGNDINFADNKKAQFGTSNDLQIYHSGTESIINHQNTGDLYIKSANSLYLQTSSSKAAIYGIVDGAVELYHNNSKKIETTSTGILTTGTLNINSAYQFPTADGSASQFLQTDGLGNLSFATVLISVVEDTTPQLGGDLDVNGNSITSTSNGDVDIAPHGTGNAKITSTGALILPVGTTAQRPNTPVVGMFRFNSTIDRFEGYNGSSWVTLGHELVTADETDYGSITETSSATYNYGLITDSDTILVDYGTIV